jgi:SynChlorMet cassette protein ScmD
MNNDDRPVRNPFVVLREEFDDWAILFDPDTGHGFGLSPTGVYLWKLLGREHTTDKMLTALRRDALDVPEDVHHDVGAFVDALVAEGLADFQSTESGPHTDGQGGASYLGKVFSPEGQSEAKPFTYGPPKLVNFSEERAVGAACCDMGSTATENACGSGTAGMNAHCLPGGVRSPQLHYQRG